MAQNKYSDEENEELKILSDNISYYRKKSKKSQKAVAESIGYEKQNYRKIEKGKQNVSYFLLGKIARATNTTPDKLIENRKKKQPNE